MMTAVDSEGKTEFTSRSNILWYQHWTPASRVLAGTAYRGTDQDAILKQLPNSPRFIQAEQIHGRSIAMIESNRYSGVSIPGCDALITHLSSSSLFIRTADCIPLFFSDPSRGVVGLAHIGWRGLNKSLPMHLVSAFRRNYHSNPKELHVLIGPAIRVCCYEVGEEFSKIFDARHVYRKKDHLVCDLPNIATEQLIECGISREHIQDSKECTACDLKRWFSLRREGPETGRLLSFIMTRS